jgi:hypothetical protein
MPEQIRGERDLSAHLEFLPAQQTALNQTVGDVEQGRG